MKLFEFNDYRSFWREKFKCLPKGGHGELRRMAEHMGVHTTTISQIYGGTKVLTFEQAASFGSYFKLDDSELEYLILLVHIDRSGTEQLKNYFKQRAQLLLKKSQDRAESLKSIIEMEDLVRARFYSSWVYSASRILSSIEEYQSIDSIAKYLGLQSDHVAEVIEFLLENGLCKREGKKIIVGPTHTHAEGGSIFAKHHYLNWRSKCLEFYDNQSKDDFTYTAPFSVSREGVVKIKKLLESTLDKITQIIEESDPEVMCCLNLDCVEIKSVRERFL